MSSSDNQDRRAIVLPGLLIGLCLACDFLMMPTLMTVPPPGLLGPPSLPGAALWLTIVGCVLAQGNLLAAWLAWSDRPFWERFTRHWTVAAMLYLIWAAGLALSQLSLFAGVSSVVGLSVPLVSIAAQIPLWIARQTLGWRLVRGDPSNDTGPAPLSIRHLMWATVLVALSLTLARWAPIPDDDERPFLWTAMFVAASVISTFGLLPIAGLALRMQPLRRGLLYAGLYAAFWVGLLWAVVLVGRHYRLFTPPPLFIMVGVTCLIVSFTATVMLAVVAVRSRGYRLLRGRLPRRGSGA